MLAACFKAGSSKGSEGRVCIPASSSSEGIASVDHAPPGISWLFLFLSQQNISGGTRKSRRFFHSCLYRFCPAILSPGRIRFCEKSLRFKSKAEKEALARQDISSLSV